MPHEGVVPPDHSDRKVVPQAHMVQHGMLEFGLISSSAASPNALLSVWCGLLLSLRTGGCCAHTILPCFIRVSSRLTTVMGRQCNRRTRCSIACWSSVAAAQADKFAKISDIKSNKMDKNMEIKIRIE